MWDYEPMMYGWREGKMPAAKPPADAKSVWENVEVVAQSPAISVSGFKLLHGLVDGSETRARSTTA